MHERPIRELSIDRSSSTAGSVSIGNPSINMLGARGNGRSPLVQGEVVPRAFSFESFRTMPHTRLVECDGSQGDLMAEVWPDLRVEESSPRFYVVQLRPALGVGQGDERYVTNVPGRGYGFVARVRRAPSPCIPHLYE